MQDASVEKAGRQRFPSLGRLLSENHHRGRRNVIPGPYKSSSSMQCLSQSLLPRRATWSSSCLSTV